MERGQQIANGLIKLFEGPIATPRGGLFYGVRENHTM